MGLRMNELLTSRMYRLSNVNFTVASFSGALAFRLNQLPNYAEFTALFDCYKIWKAEVQFIPKYNVSDYSSGGSAYGLPTIYIAEDRNNAVAPATINALAEFSTCIARRFDRPITYTCWPTLTVSGVGAGGGVIIDDRQKDLWIRNQYPDVDHYGCLYAVDMPVGLGDFKCDIVVKMFLKFKDVI